MARQKAETIIVYSPSDKTIHIGKGVINKDNTVTFNDSARDQPKEVTNTTTRMVAELVKDSGGAILWHEPDGIILQLSVKITKPEDK